MAPGQNAASVASLLSVVTGTRVALTPIVGANVDPTPHRIAFWLAGVSLAVLLAGLPNGATLSLVRSARRRRDTSIRVSLGATRGRLARQLLIESAIVASVATCVALVLGYWLDEIVRRLGWADAARACSSRLTTRWPLGNGMCGSTMCSWSPSSMGPGSLSASGQDDLLTSAVERIRTLPGVASATVFAVLPFRGVNVPPISIPGRSGEPRLDGELPFMIASTPELLEILGIDIVEGHRIPAMTASRAEPNVLLRAD